jgi:hypothetical protein
VIHPDVLDALARESGRTLGEVGVRPEDTRWIATHAEAIASLAGVTPRRSIADRLESALRRIVKRLR